MNNIRWANPAHIGICYDEGSVVVYLDSGDVYNAIIAGEHGPIAQPSVINGGTPVTYTRKEATELRQKAYQAESDPIYFKVQRGEATQEQWLAAIKLIKLRYPLAGE